jgi:hypothetical protein
MTRLNETKHAAAFLLSEADGYRSRRRITLANSTAAEVTLRAGLVLGAILVGALSATAAAFAGNTGNGAMSAITVDAGAPQGVWRVLVIEPGANAGVFIVERPDGRIDGRGTVGTAYDGGINFTLADGSADFVSGDGFNITVTAATATNQGAFVAHAPAATNGTQTPAGVLFDDVTIPANGTAEGVAIDRDAEVRDADLVWNGHSDPQKAAARAGLEALGIRVRS